MPGTFIQNNSSKHPNLLMCTLVVRGDFNVEIQQLLFGNVPGR